MHDSAYKWTFETLTPELVEGKVVLEAGGLNVNGSLRSRVEYLQPASYTVTDMRDGPGVDQVCDAAQLWKLGPADLVLSNEMLEHAEDWQAAVKGMILALKPGGTLILTTRSKGFPFHDHPGDHWRFPPESMRRILGMAGLHVGECIPDTDPRSPGVFARAHMPAHWTGDLLDRPGWDNIPVDKP